MADGGDRRIGFLFGVLGAVLFVLSGLLRLVSGAVVLALGHGVRAVGDWDHAVLLIGVGLIVGVFALMGRGRARDSSVMAGVILVVIALVGWLALGFAGGLLSLLGLVCVLIGGLVFLLAGR